jgi:fused signal recognition particle receptor
MGLFDSIKKKISSAASTVASAFSVERLRDGLEKTRTAFTSKLLGLLRGRQIDAALLSDVEDLLLRADVGMPTTERILSGVQRRAQKAGLRKYWWSLQVQQTMPHSRLTPRIART